MKLPFTRLAAAAAICAIGSSTLADIETVTHEGFLPGVSLSGFFFSDEIGFDSTQELITGIPKFDPALGTLTDIRVDFSFEYFVDAFIESQGILNPGVPHFASVSMDQFVVGFIFDTADGGIQGLVDFTSDFGAGCQGNPGDGDACSEFVSFGSGFGVQDASLFGSVAESDIIGSGEVEIFSIVIDNIDVFFDLDNVDNAIFDVYTEIDESTAFISVTYVYDTGGGEPDTDGDGITDNLDSCINEANPDQIDSDADGYGDACDYDINNDCAVNPIDLGLLKQGFFGSDPLLDFNNDGSVNAVDLGLIKQNFFGVPGPSGLTSVCQP